MNFNLGSPSEYIENNVFPILLPGLEEMLKMASQVEVSYFCIPLGQYFKLSQLL